MRKSLILTFLIFSASCRTNDNDVPLYSPGMQTPVCTGISITNNMDQIIGQYGIPNGYEGDCSENSGPKPGHGPLCTLLKLPYPNPTNGSFTIRYDLNKPSIVNMWIVPADFQTENSNPAVFNQGNLYIPESASVKVLLRKKVQATGSHSIIWDCRDDNNNKHVPAGFYRIYLEADNSLSWQDVFIWWKIGDVPQGLRQYLNY